MGRRVGGMEQEAVGWGGSGNEWHVPDPIPSGSSHLAPFLFSDLYQLKSWHRPETTHCGAGGLWRGKRI